jgi:hypothetical protein
MTHHILKHHEGSRFTLVDAAKRLNRILKNGLHKGQPYYTDTKVWDWFKLKRNWK